MYISIFVFKKNYLSIKNIDLHSWRFFFLKGPTFTELSSSNFFVGRTQIHSTPQIFFERTQLHFTELPSWSFFLEGLHFTELPSSKFHLEVLHFTELPSWSFFGSTSLHWTPQLKFFWNDFTSLNSPVEVFLEWFHFTELPSWSFFGMISLNWTPQFKVLFGKAPLH